MKLNITKHRISPRQKYFWTVGITVRTLYLHHHMTRYICRCVDVKKDLIAPLRAHTEYRVGAR